MPDIGSHLKSFIRRFGFGPPRLVLRRHSSPEQGPELQTVARERAGRAGARGRAPRATHECLLHGKSVESSPCHRPRGSVRARLQT
jgi:hypothetical protein